VGLLTGLGLAADVRPAHAQPPYPVHFTGAAGKTSIEAWQCYDDQIAPVNQPKSTTCWAVVVWYTGTFLGFNNYTVAGEKVWTNSFACPVLNNTEHLSRVTRNTSPERLDWQAYIHGPYDYITNIFGNVSYKGQLSRDVSRASLDPTKCTP